jgi:phosphate-selective porin OprO/OprP
VQDFALEGRIGGSLYLDGGWLAGDLFDDDDDGLVGKIRRARINTRGTTRYWRTTQYKAEFAFEDGDFFLNDFYLQWRFTRWIDTFKVGYFDPPVSLEALAGSGDRTLMEIPPAVSAFAPGFRIGAEVAGSFEHPSIAWAFNLSSIGQRPQSGDASSSPLRLTTRVVWRPWIDDAAEVPDLLHLGVSLRYQIAGGGTIRYRARPESFLSDFVIDTDDLAGAFGTVGLEALWRRGPLALQGEAFQVAIDEDDEGSLNFWGMYGQVAWALTGEVKPYDAKRAILGRTTPRRDFAPLRGHWGALELTGRLAWTDLDDGAVRGGRMLTVHLGPAWTWNRFVRVLGGYVYAHVDGVDDEDAGDAHILQTRLELAF